MSNKEKEKIHHIDLYIPEEEYTNLLLVQTITGVGNLQDLFGNALNLYAHQTIHELTGETGNESDLIEVIKQRMQRLEAAVQLMERRMRRKMKGANE